MTKTKLRDPKTIEKPKRRSTTIRLPQDRAGTSAQATTGSSTTTAAAPTTSAAGFHRIHCSNGKDALTIYLSLDEAQKLAASAPRPWLVKARLDEYDWYGELVLDPGPWNRITWATDDPDTFTDLGKAILRPGAVIRLRDEDEREWSFAIRHVARV